MRLVLVPCGRLGMVPWHGARGSVAGERRFAVQDAVISYAATARQFVETAGRILPLPGSRPVIVAPHPELAFARALARGLACSTYPDTLLYGPAMSGRPGRGTPDEVLAHMPGGTQPSSLLQLGTHARVCPDPLQSYLSLAAGERLTVERILEQGERDAHRPRGGGSAGADAAGLVVMPACGSDLSDVDHDEALALSTALLAAGWAGVVAARWNALDLRTSIMIYMFHHFLGELANSEGAVLPADALRLAQLWMLDENRSVPDGMPLLLAQPTRQAHPGGEHEDLELDDPYSWAVLSAQGR